MSRAYDAWESQYNQIIEGWLGGIMTKQEVVRELMMLGFDEFEIADHLELAAIEDDRLRYETEMRRAAE